ncbi:MAG TPA: SLBB domain-containing protein, partial [Synergistaceae bacterium]|nr:SLBB domain-containing protein [Synergistaceae bacterium]
RLRQAPVTGRLVVRVPEDPRLLKGSPYDVEMEQGDSVVIPRRMASVQVSGAVYTPLSQVYRPGLSYRQYIAQAGGFTPTADPRRIYVLRADGSALRVTASKKALTIEEGDTIVVPERIEILGKMRQTRDLIDMIYKIAASVVVFK